MLWVDKHRPTSLDAMEYHRPMAERLSRMAASGDIPHLLFYGPPGSGKKTRIIALLREIFGPGATKMKLERREFKTPSNKKIEITTIGSNHHIEINPGDVGNNDRLVIQEMVKEASQYASLDKSRGKAFKVILLTEVDRLSHAAQHALRRTMERYTATCRLILCCQSPCKVIDPVRSRCLGVRVSAPTGEEIAAILQRTARAESFTLPDALAERIALACDRNLRRALLMLEAAKVQQYPFKPDQPLQLPDWERFVDHVAGLVVAEQSPQQLLVVRSKLYELIINCIPADVVMQAMARTLMQRMDARLKPEVVDWMAFYDHRLCQGTKEIYHLEAFVARFMAIYKRFLVQQGQ